MRDQQPRLRVEAVDELASPGENPEPADVTATDTSVTGMTAGRIGTRRPP